MDNHNRETLVNLIYHRARDTLHNLLTGDDQKIPLIGFIFKSIIIGVIPFISLMIVIWYILSGEIGIPPFIIAFDMYNIGIWLFGCFGLGFPIYLFYIGRD